MSTYWHAISTDENKCQYHNGYLNVRKICDKRFYPKEMPANGYRCHSLLIHCWDKRRKLEECDKNTIQCDN